MINPSNINIASISNNKDLFHFMNDDFSDENPGLKAKVNLIMDNSKATRLFLFFMQSYEFSFKELLKFFNADFDNNFDLFKSINLFMMNENVTNMVKNDYITFIQQSNEIININKNFLEVNEYFTNSNNIFNQSNINFSNSFNIFIKNLNNIVKDSIDFNHIHSVLDHNDIMFSDLNDRIKKTSRECERIKTIANKKKIRKRKGYCKTKLRKIKNCLHQKEKHHAKGMCAKCYQQNYFKNITRKIKIKKSFIWKRMLDENGKINKKLIFKSSKHS